MAVESIKYLPIQLGTFKKENGTYTGGTEETACLLLTTSFGLRLADVADELCSGQVAPNAEVIL